jgi:hypothetical protein
MTFSSQIVLFLFLGLMTEIEEEEEDVEVTEASGVIVVAPIVAAGVAEVLEIVIVEKNHLEVMKLRMMLVLGNVLVHLVAPLVITVAMIGLVADLEVTVVVDLEVTVVADLEVTVVVDLEVTVVADLEVTVVADIGQIPPLLERDLD